MKTVTVIVCFTALTTLCRGENVGLSAQRYIRGRWPVSVHLFVCHKSVFYENDARNAL